jgi:hypothetical protein
MVRKFSESTSVLITDKALERLQDICGPSFRSEDDDVIESGLKSVISSALKIQQPFEYLDSQKEQNWALRLELWNEVFYAILKKNRNGEGLVVVTVLEKAFFEELKAQGRLGQVPLEKEGSPASMLGISWLSMPDSSGNLARFKQVREEDAQGEVATLVSKGVDVKEIRLWRQVGQARIEIISRR